MIILEGEGEARRGERKKSDSASRRKMGRRDDVSPNVHI